MPTGMDELDEIGGGGAFQWPREKTADRARKVEEVLQVQFPQAVRGYDREAVDGYVDRVRAVIAELEASATPSAAVTRAIEEITDETRDVLLRAQQSAQEITTRARDRADELSQQVERETTEQISTATHEAEQTRAAANAEATELRATSRREAEQLWETANAEVTQLRETANAEVTQLRETADAEVAELRETARREIEELWATAQQEVAQLRATARQETDQLIAAAETRVRELDDSAERLLEHRQSLLDDIASVSRQLDAIGRVEAGRFPQPGSSRSRGDQPPGDEPAPVPEFPA
jgi:DivIVA domain-containing protein